MGKKKKSHKPKSDLSASSKKKTLVLPILIVLVIGGVLFVILGGSFDNKGIDSTTRSFMVTGGETRPVLNPQQFTGMTREAYAAAKAVPEILDKIYCYCYCDDPPFNHKSLLSCFVEYHGAT